MEFNAQKIKEELIAYIRRWFDENGKDCCAVIGISGGKDSSVCAGLCAAALGKDRVIGILMPNLHQADIEDSYRLVKFLGIRSYTIPVTAAVAAVYNQLSYAGIEASAQTTINLPPRIRMATLYAVSQSLNGRVINSCNLSEDYVGYSTRWGDSVGDVSLLASFTVKEVREIGHALGLPADLVDKMPSDGLCGKTDEDNLGFSYEVLDAYIRTGKCPNEEAREKIDALHRKNEFKMKPIPHFHYDPSEEETEADA